MFTLTFKFNGIKTTKRGTDISKIFDKVRPELFLTDMFVTIKDGKLENEAHWSLTQVKRIFNDKTTREVFINNLLVPFT